MLVSACGASVLYAQMPGRTEHVQVEKVTLGMERIARRSIGHMEAINSVAVSSAVEGYLVPLKPEETPLQEGTEVQKGQILFRIDPTRYQATVQQKEAALEEIQAQLAYAKARKARYERLSKINATSEEEAESANARYEELLASEAEAKANLTRAQKDLEDCTIRAEITGHIGRIQFSEGNYIKKGDVIATIKQLDPIYVRFPLSQYDVNGIFRGPKEIGNATNVKLTTANGREYRDIGKIVIVDNILAGDTDTYTLWAEFANSQKILTPKGIGAMSVSLTDTSQVPLVPLTAVHYDENGAYIYVVDVTKEEKTSEGMITKVLGKVRRVNVPVGSIQGRLQAVYSGVAENSFVISDGAHKVRVGDSIIGIPGIHADTAEQSHFQFDEQKPVTVYTETVASIPDPTVLSCHGARIEAIDRVELRPQVQGILEVDPNLKEGQPISQGSKLFTIDRTRYQAEVAAIQAKIKGLDVRIEDAKNKYDRQVKLKEKNATSDDDVDSAKAIYDELTAKKKGTEAELILANDNLNRCTIQAPINGKIGRIFFSGGNYISDTKAPLATIVQLSPIYVRFYLSENEILSAYGNAETLQNDAEVELVTSDGTVFSETGTIRFCDNEIKTSTDTRNVWAVFNNDNKELQPGGVVSIRVKRKQDKLIPAVPRSAILTDSNGNYLYVMEHNRAVEKRVLCGTTTADSKLTPIFRGINKGDIIITGPFAELQDGTPVNTANTENK